MIKSFRHKGIKQFFETGDYSKIQVAHRKRIRLILTMLNAANEIHDLNFPSSNLHQLKGSLKDCWSINVSGNWRIIFNFIDGDVFDVNYIDYH